ncbi:hypothetical protein ABKN59_002970 [Abortiporus biennis]
MSLPSDSIRRKAYIFRSKITHSRFKPTESSHDFSYDILSFLFSINVLESGSLNLWHGFLFGYGGTFGKVLGIRPAAYLQDISSSHSGVVTIREKIVHLLDSRGYDGRRVHDAWMLTMPAYFGFEGINPLTVYYCYDSPTNLWLIIFEIHNTFGERHAHVLELGEDEDKQVFHGFTHQWTIPREFHVSPFNDRKGTYSIAVTVPSHSPASSDEHLSSSLPRILIHLNSDDARTSEGPGSLKLLAMLRPTSAVEMTPRNVLLALSTYPFALFLSFVRILYHARILHYQKRLDVYPRPEPKPATQGWHCSSGRSGTIGWQPEGMMERYARRLVQEFLKRRARELDINIVLIPGDLSQKTLTFHSDNDHVSTLVISYLAPNFFMMLLLTPSTELVLLLGHKTEKLFKVSSEELFDQVFQLPYTSSSEPSYSLTQSLRLRTIPEILLQHPSFPIPRQHVLDADNSSFVIATIICLSAAMELLEKLIFHALKARFIQGQEPWGKWNRALKVLGSDQ